MSSYSLRKRRYINTNKFKLKSKNTIFISSKYLVLNDKTTELEDFQNNNNAGVS